jgi:hypothetical protein
MQEREKVSSYMLKAGSFDPIRDGKSSHMGMAYAKGQSSEFFWVCKNKKTDGW